jgi:hypothetical protein
MTWPRHGSQTRGGELARARTQLPKNTVGLTAAPKRRDENSIDRQLRWQRCGRRSP